MTLLLRSQLTFILLLVLPTTLFAQNNEIKIQTEKLTDKLYMLKGRGGNLGVFAGPDGVLVIDAQYAPVSEKLKEAIQTISDSPIKYLINTHWHFDHTGGNENFERFGATILAQEKVRERMASGQVIELLKREVPAFPEKALPVITFDQGLKLHFNGEEVQIIHNGRAHTDGDAIVYFPASNVIHMGDVFVRYGYPFIDTSSGGSIDGIIAFLGQALDLINDETRVIPGHGEMSTKKDVIEFRNMLISVRDIVKERIAKGQSLDDIISAKPLSDYDERWNNNFIKSETFVMVVHESLTAE
ncbi:MAG: MBL fold metallo-hydrolase [Bacteroidota bacterium]